MARGRGGVLQAMVGAHIAFLALFFAWVATGIQHSFAFVGIDTCSAMDDVFPLLSLAQSPLSTLLSCDENKMLGPRGTSWKV